MAAPATVKKPSRNARILVFITALVGVTTVVLNSAQIKDYLLKPKDVVTDLSNRDMLEKIFGGVFIDSLHAGKWKEPWSEEIAGWLPGGKEKRDKDDSQNRSGDGCFYTCVEKIIRYRTLNSVTRAVVIFGTHEAQGNDCVKVLPLPPIFEMCPFVLLFDLR